MARSPRGPVGGRLPSVRGVPLGALGKHFDCPDRCRAKSSRDAACKPRGPSGGRPPGNRAVRRFELWIGASVARSRAGLRVRRTRLDGRVVPLVVGGRQDLACSLERCRGVLVARRCTLWRDGLARRCRGARLARCWQETACKPPWLVDGWRPRACNVPFMVLWRRLGFPEERRARRSQDAAWKLRSPSGGRSPGSRGCAVWSGGSVHWLPGGASGDVGAGRDLQAERCNFLIGRHPMRGAQSGALWGALFARRHVSRGRRGTRRARRVARLTPVG